MFSIEDINEMQKTIERKDRIIKVLKERVRQWVKEYNILDDIIDIKDNIKDELQQLYQDEHCDNLQLRETLQQIKEICKNSYSSANEDYYRTADKILDLINQAEGGNANTTI